MTDTNTCVICIDALTTAPIGACVPCGHCYHRDCFSGWAASRHLGNVKCPTCNTISRDFIPLYLDLDATDQINDENSLSSNDDDGSDNESTETEKTCSKVQTPLAEDESNSDVGETQRSDKHSERYRNIAKAIKSRVKRLDTIRIKQAEELNEMLEIVAQITTEKSKAKSELYRFQTKLAAQTLDLEGKRLDIVKLDRVRIELADDLRREKDKVERLQAALNTTNRELNDRRKTDMVEVKNILDMHPKLISEVKQLKDELHHQQNQNVKLQQQLDRWRESVHSRVDESLRVGAALKSRRATIACKALRQIDEAIDTMQQEDEAARKVELEDSILLRRRHQASAHAIRLTGHGKKVAPSIDLLSDKATYATSGTINLSALTSRKRPTTHGFKPFPKTAKCSDNCHKGDNVSVPIRWVGAPSKKSQSDIRNMLTTSTGTGTSRGSS